MGSCSTTEHREAARHLPPPVVAILTISDTRTPETDTGGRLIAELIEREGSTVAHREILKDEPALIRSRVAELCASGIYGAIITTGGTGIAPRDGTFEAISGLLDKELPGFGELFRMLSWQEVGAAAMLSRAVAGLRGRTLIFSIPGSTNAVQVAMEKLIVPELRHLVWEMQRSGTRSQGTGT